jgi:hypothetical protein
MSEKITKHEEGLEDLKKEILDSLELKQKSKKSSKKSSVLITVALLVLTFVSLAQTVQSATILGKVDEIKSSGVGSTTLPNNLESLPDMVGGC